MEAGKGRDLYARDVRQYGAQEPVQSVADGRSSASQQTEHRRSSALRRIRLQMVHVPNLEPVVISDVTEGTKETLQGLP